jgi:hypothetical protein
MISRPSTKAYTTYIPIVEWSTVRSECKGIWAFNSRCKGLRISLMQEDGERKTWTYGILIQMSRCRKQLLVLL